MSERKRLRESLGDLDFIEGPSVEELDLRLSYDRHGSAAENKLEAAKTLKKFRSAARKRGRKP